jgi:transposase-like protein
MPEEVSPDWVNSRNRDRRRGVGNPVRDRRAGDPKLRQGSYYSEWLLERSHRAERALASVVAMSYLLWVSTRRLFGLVMCSQTAGCARAGEAASAGPVRMCPVTPLVG